MKTKLKVVTVTLNPALDLTGSLDTLSTGSVNLIDTGSLHPAGKGINVAKVLAELGAQVTVTGLLGRDNQEPFVQLFDSLDITDRFIRVGGASRINVKIVEKSGQVSDLNFPGVTVKEDEIKRFEDTLFALAQSHDVFVIAGSLAQGVSTEYLATWIKKLQTAGKKVFFDSSNQALAAGIGACPFLIKPNDDELSTIVGHALNTTSDITVAAEKLHQQGCENVVISMGHKGVLWLDQSGWIQSTPQKMDVVSTVGAGDTLVAGLCWAQLNQWGKSQSLRFATALAAFAVMQIGVGVEDITKVHAMQEKIKITQLPRI
ncbi:1-phosphofructokinase [Psychromonas antarctica]|uniref:1-phosphofructokinase n=1 Tax=Psychromonas antarctica TaxID=67573 RepID=UPI001EE80F5C|nr:1-phosphofructokinase [Psychromonas antarctica]MCG6201964.1 1-phosphofructokinase [Psychromonas antarctica]